MRRLLVLSGLPEAFRDLTWKEWVAGVLIAFATSIRF